jgi:hypothetical protein
MSCSHVNYVSRGATDARTLLHVRCGPSSRGVPETGANDPDCSGADGVRFRCGTGCPCLLERVQHRTCHRAVIVLSVVRTATGEHQLAAARATLPTHSRVTEWSQSTRPSGRLARACVRIVGAASATERRDLRVRADTATRRGGRACREVGILACARAREPAGRAHAEIPRLGRPDAVGRGPTSNPRGGAVEPCPERGGPWEWV